MKINVRIKPRSSRNKVERFGDGYVVHVNEPPVDNKANKALIEALSTHFGIPRSKIRIAAGLRSKNKVVEIGQ